MTIVVRRTLILASSWGACVIYLIASGHMTWGVGAVCLLGATAGAVEITRQWMVETR